MTDGLIDPEGVTWGSAGDHLRARGRGVTLDLARGFVGRIELATKAFLASASDLFRNQPVAAVRLSDKEPMKVAEGWWWAKTCLSPSDPASLACYLPPVLSEMVVRGMAAGRFGPLPAPAELTYPSPEAAHAALSRACVGYGRSRAGLAPLTLPSTPGALT